MFSCVETAGFPFKTLLSALVQQRQAIQLSKSDWLEFKVGYIIETVIKFGRLSFNWEDIRRAEKELIFKKESTSAPKMQSESCNDRN